MEIINAGKEKDAVKVSVKGRMDAVTAPEFEKQIVEWMDGGESVFVVELSELDYISSAGLRSVLAVAKKLKAGGGKIILAALQDAVLEVFEISGFSSIIPIFESVDAALEQA